MLDTAQRSLLSGDSDGPKSAPSSRVRPVRGLQNGTVLPADTAGPFELPCGWVGGFG